MLANNGGTIWWILLDPYVEFPNGESLHDLDLGGESWYIQIVDQTGGSQWWIHVLVDPGGSRWLIFMNPSGGS